VAVVVAVAVAVAVAVVAGGGFFLGGGSAGDSARDSAGDFLGDGYFFLAGDSVEEVVVSLTSLVVVGRGCSRVVVEGGVRSICPLGRSAALSDSTRLLNPAPKAVIRANSAPSTNTNCNNPTTNLTTTTCFSSEAHSTQVQYRTRS
jgi:hypothetical protein